MGKIMFVLGSMQGGGAERVISILANHYTSLGFSVEIVTLLDNKVGYKLNKKITLTYLSTSNVNSFLKPYYWVKNFRTNIKKSKPDIVVSFFAKINLITLISTFKTNSLVYISERNDPRKDNRSFLIKCLTYLLYPLSDGVIFQTKYAKNTFPKNVQKKSYIIPNPIDINFDSSIEKKNMSKIVTVGKLMKQKNHKMLIEAFNLIENRIPNINLEIYGDGELRPQLLEQIESLGLNNRIHLKGKTNDVFNIVYNSKLFVLSSDFEGMSNALLEAMVLETPVVTTDCSGTDEIIEDKINGRIVEVHNTQKLAEAILDMLENYDEARAMAKNAKETVKDFSVENSYSKWDSILIK